MPNNVKELLTQTRVKRARQAFLAYASAAGYTSRTSPLCKEDRELVLTDLLTDLRHYAKDQDLDFAKCDRFAEGHFNAEA